MHIIATYGGLVMEEVVKLQLTTQQTADIKKQIGFELSEIYLTKRSLNKLRVFRLRLNEEQQQVMEEKLGQKVRELTVTRSVATRIL
jgi:chloramphenicol O-acetyltransferase